MQMQTEGLKIETKRRALGRGLESLLPSRPAQIATDIQATAESNEASISKESFAGKPLDILLTSIERNPFQTRTRFDVEKLTELAQSIAASGVVQPIVVREIGDKRYQLITGERRWLASFEAGKTHIPAIVRQVSDEQTMEMTIVENLQRTDLNPIEQARAYQRLSHEFKMTQEQMAIRTGLPRATVANFLRILKLPDAVQLRVEEGELSFGHAKALLALESSDGITAAAQKIVALSMSVRATETYVQGLLNPEQRKRPEKPVIAQDPNVRDAQDELQRFLGMRVRIEDKDGKGRVIIEYSGLEDFDTIMQTFKKQP